MAHERSKFKRCFDCRVNSSRTALELRLRRRRRIGERSRRNARVSARAGNFNFRRWDWNDWPGMVVTYNANGSGSNFFFNGAHVAAGK